AELGDAVVFNRAMSRSRVVAPNEGWLAEFRVAILEKHWSTAEAHVKMAEVDDLRVLVESQRGINVVAERYVKDENLRPRVAAALELVSDHDRRRFVDAVRLAMGQKT